MANPSVTDKVVLITGAAAGFGRKTAETLAESGASLVLTDIDSSGLATTADTCRQHGAKVVTLRHDVASQADWEAVIALADESFGRLDALVNNAGFMLTKPFLQTSLEEFRRIQAVNVESIWLGTQLAYPLLARAAASSEGGASVINISSVFGQVAGFAQAAYCTSKGAVRLLTKCTAVEFARAGSKIRVNSIHPGPGNTALGANGIKEMIEGGMANSPEEAITYLNGLIPAGHFVEPEDIADLVRFLCSDASRYLTGSELTIDGGYTAI